MLKGPPVTENIKKNSLFGPLVGNQQLRTTILAWDLLDQLNLGVPNPHLEKLFDGKTAVVTVQDACRNAAVNIMEYGFRMTR